MKKSILGVVLGILLTSMTAYATSTLIVQQGGTGVNTFTSGQLIYGNGTTPLSSVATTTVTCAGTVSCGTFLTLGSSPFTITGTGLSTDPNWTFYGAPGTIAPTSTAIDVMIGTSTNSASSTLLIDIGIIPTAATSTYIVGNVAGYMQSVIQNISANAAASADLVFCNNLSTESSGCPTYYGDLGLNSSTFTQSGFSGSVANDTYITASDGNVDINAASSTGQANIRFFNAGQADANLSGIFTSAGYFGVGTSTPWGYVSINPPSLPLNIPVFTIGSSTVSLLTEYVDGGITLKSSNIHDAISINPLVGSMNGNDISIGNGVAGLVLLLNSTSSASTTLINKPNSGILEGNSNTQNGLIIDPTSAGGPIIFGTGGSALTNERARITQGGFFGIATSAPATTSAIQGNLLVSGFGQFATLNATGTITLGSPLLVSSGGTGANTLTGCLTGNGTSPVTGSGTCNTSNASVSSVSGSGGTTGLTLSGGPITTTGILTLGGTLVLSNGGTNQTSWTPNTLVMVNAAGTALASTSSNPLYVDALIATSSTKFSGFGTTTPWALLSVNGNALGGNTPQFVVGSSTATDFYVDGRGAVGIASTTIAAQWGFAIGTTTQVGAAMNFGIASATAQLVMYNPDFATTSASTQWTRAGNIWRIILNQNNVALVLNSTSSHPLDGQTFYGIVCQDPTGSRTGFQISGAVQYGSAGTTTFTTTAKQCQDVAGHYDAWPNSKWTLVASSSPYGY